MHTHLTAAGYLGAAAILLYKPLAYLTTHLAKHSLHAKSTTHTTCSSTSRRLSLHLLRHLDIRLEEFGNASIQTDRLALVKIGFAVGRRYTFLRAGLN